MSIIDGDLRVVVPETSYFSSRPSGYSTASLTVTHEYTNLCNKPVYVKTQNNVGFYVDANTRISSADEHRPHIEIKTTYRVSNNEGIDGTLSLLRAFQENNVLTSDDARQIMDRLVDLYRRDPSRFSKTNFEFAVFRRILCDTLVRDKKVYLRDCDIVLTLDRNMMLAPHPNSNEGFQQVDVNRQYHGQAGVFVKVIDNGQFSPSRFFYSGRQVIEVPSVQDRKSESGVYCTIATMQPDGTVQPKTHFYTFEEAEREIGLYRTKQEAETNGSPEKIVELEIARAKNEEVCGKRKIAELSLLNEQLKQEFEQRSLEYKAEIQRNNHQLETMKLENSRLKESIDVMKAVREDNYDQSKRTRNDYYEERSYRRKDSSELIKYVPGLVLGVIGIFTAFKFR